MLRLLIILLCISFLVRWFLNKLFGGVSFGQMPRSPEVRGEVRDDLIPCPACGTYNPKSVAFEKSGKLYCNKECSNK